MKKKSEFVAVAGLQADLLQKLARAVYAKGGNDEDLIRIISDEMLREKIADLIVAKSPRERDDLVRLTLTSDGTTGPEWIRRFEEAGNRVSAYAKSILSSPDFTPTEKGTVHKIVVLKGEFWRDSERTTENIRSEAERLCLMRPHPEVACLIRVSFTDEELEMMGFGWLVSMHRPIKGCGGGSFLLGVSRYNDGRWLYADCVLPDLGWGRDGGFAFAVAGQPSKS